jgi:hypothetical protein
MSATGGGVATKVGYFGVKSTKVQRLQMGTKPAKVGHLQSLGVNSAKVSRFCTTKTHLPPPPPGLRSAERTKVGKVGPLRARVKSAQVRPTPYVYYPPVMSAFGCPMTGRRPRITPEDATPAAVHTSCVYRVDPQRLVHAPLPHLPPLRRVAVAVAFAASRARPCSATLQPWLVRARH